MRLLSPKQLQKSTEEKRGLGEGKVGFKEGGEEGTRTPVTFKEQGLKVADHKGRSRAERCR